MDPLEQDARLFANGKFEIKNDYGYRAKFTPLRLNDLINEKNYLHNDDTLKLIARSVWDMNNVEVAKALEHQNIKHEGRDFGYYKSWLLDVVNEDYEEQDGYGDPLEKLSAKAQNYLLSIGVYPFDQSHFDDGTVIDINEI